MSDCATRPFALDRYQPILLSALHRVMSEGWAGLNLGGNSKEPTVALSLELRQVAPADGATWQPLSNRMLHTARFLVPLYHGPLALDGAVILLSHSTAQSERCIRVRCNVAVFTTSDTAVRIPSFRPLPLGCDQDLFVLTGHGA